MGCRGKTSYRENNTKKEGRVKNKIIVGVLVILIVLVTLGVGCRSTQSTTKITGFDPTDSFYDSEAEIALAPNEEAVSVLYTKYSGVSHTTWYIYFKDSQARIELLDNQNDGKAEGIAIEDRELDVIIRATDLIGGKGATMAIQFSTLDMPLSPDADFEIWLKEKDIESMRPRDAKHVDSLISVEDKFLGYKKVIQLSPDVADLLLEQANFMLSQLRSLSEDKAGN
jgi:hypothetical protein